MTIKYLVQDFKRRGARFIGLKRVSHCTCRTCSLVIFYQNKMKDKDKEKYYAHVISKQGHNSLF